MQRRAELEVIENIGFNLEDIAIAPAIPRMNEPITVSGKVKLFKLPFVAPIWVIVTATYPERWWEEIIPIIGSPEVREMAMVVGGQFKVTFKKGFDREDEFGLAVRAYAGPTLPINTLTLPPFPPVATEETTFTILGEMPPEEISFSLVKPTVMPATEVEPGTDITISCPVTSECTRDRNIRVKCIIYEGSILPGHGIKLAEFTSGVTPISPGETKTFDFSRRTVEGTIDRRDIQVEVYIDGTLVKESEWDDVYYVGRPPEEVIDFDLTRPSVTPATITPGTPITITCPVTSACTKEQSIKVKVIIYEGSVLPGHGAVIATKWSPIFTISPYQTYNMTIHHTAVAGTIDRRDIQVEVYIDDRMVKESEWDDVYYIEEVAVEERWAYIEEYITGGRVVSSPAPKRKEDAKWYYDYGARVTLTAIPDSGYKWVRWSYWSEVENQNINPTYMTMTENRGDFTRRIVPEFERIVVEEYTLTISIQPYGGGTVTKSPDKPKYSKGEYVTLIASPASGYEFDHWSGDVSGYSTLVSVYMDRNKSVVANFKKAVPPPTEIVSFTVKGDGFPFLTSYWKLYHYDRAGNIWQDYTLHRPGDIIHVRNVQSASRLSCHCVSSVTGEWSEQYYSREFAAIDGKDYRYDIASGIVYYR